QVTWSCAVVAMRSVVPRMTCHVVRSHVYRSFFFPVAGAPGALHSFPTRRSSDLFYSSRNVLAGSIFAILRVGSVVASSVTNTRRSEEHTSELQSHLNVVCRLLLEKRIVDDVEFGVAGVPLPDRHEDAVRPPGVRV